MKDACVPHRCVYIWLQQAMCLQITRPGWFLPPGISPREAAWLSDMETHAYPETLLSGRCWPPGDAACTFPSTWATAKGHQFSSIQFCRSVVSDSLRPHELQHTRPSCPSPIPGVHSNSCPSSQKQRHYFASKGPFSQGYGFSSSYVWI